MVAVAAAVLIFIFIIYAAPVLQRLKSKGAKVQPGGASAAKTEGQQKSEEEKIVPVVAHKVEKSDFEDTLPAMGTIKGIKEIELRFEVNGVIDAINFKEADIIKRGDTIAALNQQDAILKLEYAQSKLKTSQTQMLTAKKKLEIHQKLYSIGSIIKSKLEEIALEYENTKSQVTSAEKEVSFAKQEIQKAYLTSPIDGVMGSRDAEAGEFVTSTTKIGTVIDISSVYAEVGIIEKDIQKVALGQEGTITVDAYPNTEFKGAIDNVLPVIEGKSRTLTARIKIDNSQGQLLPGMFASGTIYVFGQKGAIVIPAVCQRDKDNDGNFDSVFVVGQDNIAHLRDISIGYVAADNVVVDSGLEEGELIVSEARGELTDGATVEVLETQEVMKPTEQPVEEGSGEKDMVIQ